MASSSRERNGRGQLVPKNRRKTRQEEKVEGMAKISRLPHPICFVLFRRDTDVTTVFEATGLPTMRKTRCDGKHSKQQHLAGTLHRVAIEACSGFGRGWSTIGSVANISSLHLHG